MTRPGANDWGPRATREAAPAGATRAGMSDARAPARPCTASPGSWAPIHIPRFWVWKHRGTRLACLASACGAVLLTACSGDLPRPLNGLNRQLEQLAPAREPALTGRWLALIGQRGGRDRVMLIDLERGLPVPLPGLDRPDAQPLAVAVDASGERLALVRQRDDQTELVLYRRSVRTSERVPMLPAGVPRRLSLQADGRQLALEVSRGGIWQVDLINLP